MTGSARPGGSAVRRCQPDAPWRHARASRYTGSGARRRAVHVDLLGAPWGDAAYPYWLPVPQYANGQILESNLASLGVLIEWNATLDAVADRGEYVEAKVRHSDGRDQAVRSRVMMRFTRGGQPVCPAPRSAPGVIGPYDSPVVSGWLARLGSSLSEGSDPADRLGGRHAGQALLPVRVRRFGAGWPRRWP